MARFRLGHAGASPGLSGQIDQRNGHGDGRDVSSAPEQIAHYVTSDLGILPQPAQ